MNAFGQGSPGCTGVVESKQEAEEALRVYRTGKETEEEPVEFASDPADRPGSMMNHGGAVIIRPKRSMTRRQQLRQPYILYM